MILAKLLLKQSFYMQCDSELFKTQPFKSNNYKQSNLVNQMIKTIKQLKNLHTLNVFQGKNTDSHNIGTKNKRFTAGTSDVPQKQLTEKSYSSQPVRAFNPFEIIPKYTAPDDLSQESESVFVINVPNFKERVMSELRRLVLLLEATANQKKLILEKVEDILDKHISRAKGNEITIPKNSNPLTNAAAIIYAVLVSNENMPNISGIKLSEMIRVSKDTVTSLYRKLYKDLRRKLDFNFQSAKLGRSRRIISLYLFELLLNTRFDLPNLISHLIGIDTSELVLRLREIIINASKPKNFLEQLTEREIKMLQDMATNYSDSFTKYFSDLVDIIKLLIISNKSHKIIGADFSILHFVRFLIDKGINLFLTEHSLVKVIGNIFIFLKDTKYSNLFPTQMRSEGDGTYVEDKTGEKRRKVVGSRIKLYAMEYIYNGRYFVNGIATCLECLSEGFTVNSSSIRIVSREFHHESRKLEEYTISEFYRLFNNNRGNPYFLQYLINKMESESVVLKCGSHHNIIHAFHFINFKKLISWENIPREFPQDIFDLPAEIIHILVMICVENSNLPEPLERSRRKKKLNTEERRYRVRTYILNFIKKRYIIDCIYGGICPVCGEFNTIDHLPAFEFNHLYKLRKLTPKEKERYKRIKKKVSELFYLPCSELVRELESQKGGYVCHNCHFVIHEDISIVNKIYEDQNIMREVLKDNENTIRHYKQSLIHSIESIKDPLKSENHLHRPFMDYLIALFEISKRKQGGVTRDEILNYLGQKSFGKIFEKRKVSEKYLRIVAGTTQRPTRYYINDEGRRIVRLMYYFRDYYRNLSS